jgi:hypothetical protein
MLTPKEMSRLKNLLEKEHLQKQWQRLPIAKEKSRLHIVPLIIPEVLNGRSKN